MKLYSDLYCDTRAINFWNSINTDIKLKYPLIEVVDKIEEAKQSFIKNPYKYLDNTKFEIEI